MDQKKLNKIIEAAANGIKKPTITATIAKIDKGGFTVNTEYNVNSKREAAALVACLASGICDNRADYNALITLIRKQINQDKRIQMAERRK